MVSLGTQARTNGHLDAVLGEAIAAYIERNPKSARRHEDAALSMPGGNTRTVLFFSPFPLCIARGEGCRLWDADGHEYIDMLGEFTAGIYGHSDPTIRAAIDEALDGGVNLSGHNRFEVELARVICDRFPSIDLVRFTNSGTEANLMGLAAATAFTGRRKIVVFEKGYHGGVLSFPPGGSRTNVPHDFVMATYNDIEGTRALIRKAGADLAAVLVEPMLGAGGCVPGTQEFLAMLRAETTAAGGLLIFDEVMTSRLSPGGRQAQLGIVPDLTTLGKYIGGGMSFGAFGGRADIMSLFDPRRPDALAHAGTFNNNVLTMSAGLAGMTKVLTPERCIALNALGDRLRDELNAVFTRQGAALLATGLGSINAIQGKGDAETAMKLRDLVFFGLLERGFYIARRGLMTLSLPVGEAEIAAYLAAVEDTVVAHRDVLCA